MDEMKRNLKSSSDAPVESRESKYSKLLAFMDDDDAANSHPTAGPPPQDLARSLRNSPIFTAAVDRFVESRLPPGEDTSELVPQYGLIGSRRDPGGSFSSREDGLIMGNVNMPWSAFICGSQGAGKSHTLCCLLENALVANNEAGALPSPLAGMVFHYDRYSSQSTTQICEAAYLCSSGIPVTILASPSNIWAMKRLYGNMPGLPPGSPRPKVVPLYLDEDQLDISRILKLMAVDPAANKTPLYMEALMSIVREIAMSGEKFTYTGFRQRLAAVRWLSGQQEPLNMRLQLLDSFIRPSSLTQSTRPAPSPDDIWAFEPGSLTIVDLSDPFVSSDEACTIFSICLSIFLEGRQKCGRIIAMDEAHKFLAQSGEARVLTNELISVIRQQRHTGTRAIIATQEPTLSPELIALSNATFVHRFLSPAWYEVLRKHLAGADKHDGGGGGKTNSRDRYQNSLFRTIVGLRTGQALLFCPTAVMDVVGTDGGAGGDGSAADSRWPMPLNDGYVNIRIRKRLTVDGGKSIMAMDTAAVDSALQQQQEQQRAVEDENHVPMFVVEPRAEVDDHKMKKKEKKRANNENPPHAKNEDAADDAKLIAEARAEFQLEQIVECALDNAHLLGKKKLPNQTKKERNKFFNRVESMTGNKLNTISGNPRLRSAVYKALDLVVQNEIRAERTRKRLEREKKAKASKAVMADIEAEGGEEAGFDSEDEIQEAIRREKEYEVEDDEGPNRVVESGVLQYEPAVEEVPEEDIPEEDIPEEEDVTEENDVLEEDIPEEVTEAKDVPEEDIPEEVTEAKDVPEEDIPEEVTEAKDVPEEDIPEEVTEAKDVSEVKGVPKEKDNVQQGS